MTTIYESRGNRPGTDPVRDTCDHGCRSSTRQRSLSPYRSLLLPLMLNGLTLTGAGRTRKEYRTRDNGAAVGVRCSVELDGGR
jgi:hypothetical protein